MLDYYKILGISRSADYATIRSAYKRLALQYHPDRNPNNKAAEEFFKVVNEAKQLLSDPQKRAQYDLILNYIYEASQRKVAQQTYSKYRQTPSYTHYREQPWQSARNFPQGTGYKIDKNYYKVQLLTLIVVALISILSIGIFKATEYLEEKKNEEIRIKNERVLAEAQELYDKGNYRKALNMVISLIRKNPIEKRFFTRKESMVAGLNNKAIALYQKADYKKAVVNLEILREYQSPMQLSTWNMIADCNSKLGIYGKAIHALEYIRIRDQDNIELVMRIGDIYYNDLHMSDKALEYYDKAKEMFKTIQSSSYGEAFELVMLPEQTPQIYFAMFSKRAEINMAAGNYQEAITDYNWAAFLRPKNATSYHYRAICRQKDGNYSRACKDWEKALSLGSENSRQWINKYCR